MKVLVLALFAPLSVFARNASSCYYQDGTLDTTTFPCNNGQSGCCPENFFCINNGLCYNPHDDNYFGRYTCKMKEWDSSCPQNCLAAKGGNEAVKKCSEGKWCCNHDEPDRKDQGLKSCCEDDEGQREMFDFGLGAIFAWIQEGVGNKASGPLEFRERAVESSTSEPSSTASSSASQGGLIAGAPQMTSRNAWAPQSTTLDTSASSSGIATAPPGAASTAVEADPEANNAGPRVGIAVGVPCAVVALIVVGLLLWHKRKSRKAEQAKLTPFDFGAGHEGKDVSAGGFVAPMEKDRTSKVPSEIDSREVRYPIRPQDTASMASGGNDFSRDHTTNTLYPNAQPNYNNPMSPPLPTGTSASSVFSHPSQDYSEWAVTPRLQQQRWSGTPAQDRQGGQASGGENGIGVAHGGEQGHGQAHEIMRRPKIPPTIHELP